MAGVICGGCGHESQAGAWFCAFCAEPLASSSTPLDPPPSALLAALLDARDPGAHTRADPASAFDDHTEAMLDALSHDLSLDELDRTLASDESPDRWVIIQRTHDTPPGVVVSSDAEVVLALLDKPQSMAALEGSGTLSRRALDLSLMSLREQGLIELSTSDDREGLSPWAFDHTAPDAVVAPDPAEDLDPLSTAEGPPPSGFVAEDGLAEDYTRAGTAAAAGSTESASAAAAGAAGARPLPTGTVTRRLIPRLPDAQGVASLQHSDLADGIVRLSLLSKAEQLARAAQRDRRTGSVLSARMNLLLAMALAPDEPSYPRALEELSARAAGPSGASGGTPAEQRYEQARRFEAAGQYAQAIVQLRAAIELEERGAYYHRLGVLLAVHQRERVLGERMLRRATELEPENRQYVQSLAKIISADALRADGARGPARPDGARGPARAEGPRAEPRPSGRRIT